jgi:tetratricopeptide (TPR) repeat protein
MRITLRKLNASHLTANERALVQCEAALELKDKGDYQGARDALSPIWNRVGERPDLSGIHPSVAAEVLLCVGILTRWIGSKDRLEEAQETAKNLITESITYYQSVSDAKRVAAAQVEMACCYWREGQLDEARITLNEALQVLTLGGTTRARAVLRLAIVEWSDSQLSEALRILTESASLFEKITNHAIKGAYYSHLANVLTNLATAEKRSDYFQRAISEYQKADDQFRLAHNSVFRADVKNNVGFLLYNLSRFQKAHEYLEQARRIRTSVRDKVGIAQIDDTRAQVLIAQKKFKQAEAVARGAVRVLERSGHQCLLADALVTQGIAVARLKRGEQAQFIFQKAIEVASQVGASNKAGIAALTLIEEVDGLSPDTLFAAYYRADEWLAKSQSQELLSRLNAAARKVCSALYGTVKGEDAIPEEDAVEALLLNKPCVLQTEVWKFEGRVIQQALAKANGSVTRAATMLSMSYQALAYILDSRHTELLNERSPIRRRSRKEAKT